MLRPHWGLRLQHLICSGGTENEENKDGGSIPKPPSDLRESTVDGALRRRGRPSLDFLEFGIGREVVGRDAAGGDLGHFRDERHHRALIAGLRLRLVV